MTIYAKHARAAAALSAAIAAAAVTAGSARAQDPMMAPTTAPTTAPAAAKTVDNPQYAMWSKFKVGSSSTMEGDVASPMGNAHVAVTQTLKEITADAVTLEVVTKVTMMGQTQDAPTQTTKVEAKEEKEDSTETGKEDVDAAGKTFHCTIREQATTGKGQPLPGGAKAKFDVSDEVPGGVVKAVLPGPAGKSMTMTLKDMNAK